MPRTRTVRRRQEEALRLRRVRTLLGLTQREMAEQFGVAHGAIGLWESGARTIPGPALVVLRLFEEELGMADQEQTRGLDKIKTSWIARTWKLSRTGASAGARFAAGAVQQILEGRQEAGAIRRATQAAVARQMVEALGTMKGLVMKIGQMVSYLDPSLPQEVRDALATLQASTPPMSPSVIATVFVEELGKTPREVFVEWDPIPFSAASIGQVHRARLQSGEEVAVKVQYPEVEKAIQSDLKSAAMVDQLGALLFRGQERGTFVREISERFLEECDYEKEAASQEEFTRLFQGDSRLVIPRVFRELSTRRILTMEYVRGRSFQDLLSGSSQRERNFVGEVLWDFAFESIWQHSLFNADPHPGNYLFQERKVVFLDFGCVKRFAPSFMTSWRALARALLEQDRAAHRDACIAIGFARDPERFDFEYQFGALSHVYTPWLIDRPFAYTAEFVRETFRRCIVAHPNNRSAGNMPPDFVFLNRINWGLFSILASLGTTLNWRRKLLPMFYGDNPAKWPPPVSMEAIREPAAVGGRT